MEYLPEEASRIFAGRGIPEYCLPEEFRVLSKGCTLEEYHLEYAFRISAGGGLQEYCPPEEPFRSIVSRGSSEHCQEDAFKRIILRTQLEFSPDWAFRRITLRRHLRTLFRGASWNFRRQGHSRPSGILVAAGGEEYCREEPFRSILRRRHLDALP